VDAQAIGIVSQVKDGDNPASLILVETLLGLDFAFHGRESQKYLRSPLTLQIWSMDESLNSMELLLVEVPTSSVVVSGIRSHLHSQVKEGNFL